MVKLLYLSLHNIWNHYLKKQKRINIFVLAWEVEYDLGGQRSLNKICGELTNKVAYKIS